MKNFYCVFYTLASLLLVTGCASVLVPSPSNTITADAAQQDATLPQAATDMNAVPVPKPVISANPAVIALLERAQNDAVAGKREAAGASLERALRIEPRNAWLWNELAQTRHAQGQYALAIALAQKSNSFAGSDRRLQAVNWRTIGNARVAQGNRATAELAFKHAVELEQ